jgi:hypothetical protein
MRLLFLMIILFCSSIFLESCKGLNEKETEIIKDILISEKTQEVIGTDLHKEARQYKLDQAIKLCEESIK